MAKPSLLLAGDFPPLGGGIARYLYEIVRSLPPVQIRVIGLPAPGWEDFDCQQTFAIQRLDLPARWDVTSAQFKFLAPFYFWKLSRNRHVNIVLCGQAHHTLMLPAWLTLRIWGTPYGVFVYGLDLLRPQTSKYRRFFNHLLHSAQVIFADSHAVAEISKNLGMKQERIHVISPPVDVKRLTDKASPKTMRRRYNLVGKKCILTVGRLVERKGHDIVIKALPSVIEAIPELHYLIVGSGPTETYLRTLVRNLGLEEYVTLVGRVADDELGSYYAACDVFAMISREIPEKGDIEGFGMVFLEANLLGKPVIGGRSGGVPDAVLHEQTGLLVDPHDPSKVALALVRLLSNPELAHTLGKMGQARVLRDFSSEAVAHTVSSILLSIEKGLYS